MHVLATTYKILPREYIMRVILTSMSREQFGNNIIYNASIYIYYFLNIIYSAQGAFYVFVLRDEAFENLCRIVAALEGMTASEARVRFMNEFGFSS